MANNGGDIFILTRNILGNLSDNNMLRRLAPLAVSVGVEKSRF